jgi:HlyD family secretion protein
MNAIEVRAAGSGMPSCMSRASFDQLDNLVRVTRIQGWVYLGTLFLICASATAFALIYEVPSKVSGEGILLIEKDSLSRVRAQGTGRLVNLTVKEGDPVWPDQVIGEISQEDLSDAIREAETKLRELRREDQELTRFEKTERKTQGKAIAKVKQALVAAEENLLDELKIAGRVVEGADRLRAKMQLGDQDLLDSREKFHVIRDNLNKGQARMADLDLDGIKGENARIRAQIERRLKIGQLETRLELDRHKLARMSHVVSHVRGQVTQVLSARDELVHEGSPVVLLHASKETRGTDGDGPPYESIVFVPAGEGKKIEVGNRVEVMPATVKREEYGYIRGQVVDIAELPATKLAMEAALEHPELVDAFLKRYAPGVLLRVHVQLKLDQDEPPGAAGRSLSQRRNPFQWSSSSGRKQTLKTGTMCQAAIVVERRKLFSLILPWTKRLAGTD